MTRFGQCCLLARRLVEAGVRFVTVNTFITVFDEITWDIHGSKPFTSIAGMKDIVAPMYDQGYSARCSKTFSSAACWTKRMVCQPRRIRPHAQDQSSRRARPLAQLLDDLFRRRRRQGRARRRQERRHRRLSRRSVPSTRRKSSPPSIKSLGLNLETHSARPAIAPVPARGLRHPGHQGTFLMPRASSHFLARLMRWRAGGDAATDLARPLPILPAEIKLSGSAAHQQLLVEQFQGKIFAGS